MHPTDDQPRIVTGLLGGQRHAVHAQEAQLVPVAALVDDSAVQDVEEAAAAQAERIQNAAKASTSRRLKASTQARTS